MPPQALAIVHKLSILHDFHTSFHEIPKKVNDNALQQLRLRICLQMPGQGMPGQHLSMVAPTETQSIGLIHTTYAPSDLPAIESFIDHGQQV